MSEQICPTEYWQKSRFVDHRQYQNRPEEWKEEMRQLEATTIRGGGAVGSPACNVLFKIEGQHANQYRDAIIGTIAELTALRKERDALAIQLSDAKIVIDETDDLFPVAKGRKSVENIPDWIWNRIKGVQDANVAYHNKYPPAALSEEGENDGA